MLGLHIWPGCLHICSCTPSLWPSCTSGCARIFGLRLAWPGVERRDAQKSNSYTTRLLEIRLGSCWCNYSLLTTIYPSLCNEHCKDKDFANDANANITTLLRLCSPHASSQCTCLCRWNCVNFNRSSLQMCSLSISPEFAVDGSAGFRLSELRCAIGLAIGIAFLACAAIAAREPPQHE